MPIRNKKRPLYHVILPTPVIVEDQGVEKEVIAFQDNHGFILTKEEVIKARDELIKEIERSKEFYVLDGVEEAIRIENVKTCLSSLSFEMENSRFPMLI
ncbi:hypothetical protein [Oceanobacillus kapialis]|uniref:Uncharacterized protein n=1 Tax=Oceanobacillus kapialis TaxID=481353 RepID=A0ABW5PW82_9BACI